MSRQSRNIWASGIAAALVAVASVVFPALLHGFDAGKASPPPNLVVHEWGTFTSFSGSNGVNLEFRPLVTSDLPRFIMTPFNQPGSVGSGLFEGKGRFYARQRMETPVTYFYTDVPRTVNVRVDFPQGALTEWYPVVKKFHSGKADGSLDIIGRAYLDWGGVRLTPPNQFASIRVVGAKKQAVAASLPPVDANDHYGRARETDSAIIETVDANHGSHFEKFLFYRGLSNFDLPIKLTALGNDQFEVTNSGDEASGALLLMRIDNGLVRFTRMEPIHAHSAIEVALTETESTIDQLTEATIRELTAAGLYAKESLAMVNTWRTSWFGENGTRLLYLVPNKQTDKLLPLKVDPAPNEQVRVLVGRLETVTPEDCRELVHNLVGANANELPADDSIKEELKSLGRFAEPAIKFAITQTVDVETSKRLEVVLAKVHAGKI